MGVKAYWQCASPKRFIGTAANCAWAPPCEAKVVFKRPVELQRAHAQPMIPTDLKKKDFVIMGNVEEHSKVCLCAGDAGLHRAPGVPLRHFLAGKRTICRNSCI